MEATWGAASLVAVIKYSTKSNLSWPRVPEETQSITAGRHKKARQEVWKQRVEVGSESSCKPSRPHPPTPTPVMSFLRKTPQTAPPAGEPNTFACGGQVPFKPQQGGFGFYFVVGGFVCLLVGHCLTMLLAQAGPESPL